MTNIIRDQEEFDYQDPEVQAEYGHLTKLYFATDEKSINLIGERSGAFGFTEDYFWVGVRDGEDFQFFETLEEATAAASKKKKPLVYEAFFQAKELAKALSQALNSKKEFQITFMVKEILSFS